MLRERNAVLFVVVRFIRILEDLERYEVTKSYQPRSSLGFFGLW